MEDDLACFCSGKSSPKEKVSTFARILKGVSSARSDAFHLFSNFTDVCSVLFGSSSGQSPLLGESSVIKELTRLLSTGNNSTGLPGVLQSSLNRSEGIFDVSSPYFVLQQTYLPVSIGYNCGRR